MSRLALTICIEVFLTLTLYSCADDAGFKGGSVSRDPSPLTPEVSFEGLTKPESCSPATRESQIPITVNFIVDVSSTMTDEIDVLKRNLRTFLGLIRASNISSINYSITSFVDRVRKEPRLMKAEQISSELVGLNAEKDSLDPTVLRNIDMPEAGFEAIIKAQEVGLKSPAQNIYVVITDDLMHYGGGPGFRSYDRDCSVSRVARNIRANSKVLIWTNDVPSRGDRCSAFFTGKEQVMELGTLRPNVRYMGSQFRPFDLTNQILSLVKNTVITGC